jgi:ADP-heptose:LPS heptosyltransferase
MEGAQAMLKFGRFARWKQRFNLQYAPVVGELPALIRLQSLKPRKVSSPETILIVNCCLIGDFVLSLPSIQDFRKDHPRAEIDLIVSPTVAPLAQRLRGVRRVYAARTIFRRETEMGDHNETLAPSYDLVVVLRLSSPARRLLATTSYRAIRTYLVPLLSYGFHLGTRPVTNIKQLSELNFEVFGKRGRDDRYICADDVLDLKNVPAVDSWPGRKVIVHTGSGSRFYLWPVEKWVMLLEILHHLENISFIFVGGTEQEQRTLDEIADRVPFQIHSVIRRYNLLEVLMLMRDSTLFVGIDSGPRHLAHLIDLPSVCLLGPGPKGFQPLNGNATVIDETECKRCYTLYCPHSPNCIGKIEVETVARACRETLVSSH